MDTEKLGTPLGKAVIKHTRHKFDAIRFRDDAINKVKKDNYNFGNKRYLYIPFKVSKDSHQKGLKLKILKGSPGDNNTVKTFYLVYWFNGKGLRHNNMLGRARINDVANALEQIGGRNLGQVRVQIDFDIIGEGTSFTKPTLYLIRRQDEFIGNTPQEIVAKVQYRPIHIAKRYN